MFSDLFIKVYIGFFKIYENYAKEFCNFLKVVIVQIAKKLNVLPFFE